MNGETADGKNLQFGFFEYGYFVRIHWGKHGQLTPYYTCPTCGWGKGRQFNGVNTPVIFGYRYTNGEFQLGKGCGSSFQALYKAKFAGPITNIDISPDNGYHVSMTTSAFPSSPSPSSPSPSSPSPPAYACDASRDYIRNMAYAQTSLTDYCHIQPAADRPTTSGDVCNANPKYGGANSDARALAYCERACTAKPASSCTGFFFQRHRNGHEICGFYSTALGAAQSWNYAGAHAASAVCRRNSLATTKAPATTNTTTATKAPCAQVGCLPVAPPPGCRYEQSGEKNAGGCPKHPCGVLKCTSTNSTGSSYSSGGSGSGSYSPCARAVRDAAAGCPCAGRRRRRYATTGYCPCVCYNSEPKPCDGRRRRRYATAGDCPCSKSASCLRSLPSGSGGSSRGFNNSGSSYTTQPPAPTRPPTQPPTQPPTRPPTRPTTQRPTRRPTRPPTRPPTQRYNSGSSGSGSYSPFDSHGSSRGSNNSGSSYSKAPAPFVRAAGAANCPVDRMITTEAECRRAGAAIGRPFAKAVNTAAARWTQAVRFGAGFTNCHPLSHGELFIGEQTQAACRARCVASISCMATVQLDRSATGAIRGSAPCWLKNWCQEVAHTGPKTYISFLRDSSIVDGGGGRPAGCFWDQNGRSYLNKNLRGFATWNGVGGLCRGFNATAPPAPPALGEQCLGFNTLPCAKGLVCQDPKKTAVRDVNSCAPGYCWCAKKPTAATAAPAPTPHPSALLLPAAVEAVVVTIRTKLSGFTVSSFSAGIQHAYRLAFARAAGVADAETVFIRNVRQVVAAAAAAPTVAAERALAAASGAGPGVAFDVHVATATAAESEALSTRSRALAPAAVVTEFVAQIDAVAASARFADVPPTMAGQFDPARITQETADPHVYTTAQDAGLPTKFYQSAAATAEGEGTEEEGAGGSTFSGPSAAIAAGSGCLVLIGAAVAVHQRGRRTIMALRRTIAAADAADGAGGGIVARNQLEVAIALPIMAAPNGKQLFDPAGGTVLAALPISPSNPAVDMGDPFRLPTMAMAAAMPPVEPVAVAVPVAAPGRRGRAEQQQQQQLAHAVVVQPRHSVVEV